MLAHGVHDLLEAEGHRLISKLTNVFGELLVNFLCDAVGPRRHLILSELHLFIDLFSLLALFLGDLDGLVELGKFGCQLWLSGGINLVLLLILIVVHLQLLELLSPVLVVLAELVDLGFVLGH